VQATVWAHICEDAINSWAITLGRCKQQSGPIFVKMRSTVGPLLGKVQATVWAHICEDAINSWAITLGRCKQQSGPIFVKMRSTVGPLLGKVQATNYAHYFFYLVKRPAADATDAPQPSRLVVQPCDEVLFCFSNLMEHRWNEIDRGKPTTRKKNLSQCHFVRPQVPH
jgi:hypothetical protein